jgi:hypothetical protein
LQKYFALEQTGDLCTLQTEGKEPMMTATGRREKSGSADDCPIGITPEMIEAGINVLNDYFCAELLDSWVDPEEVCTRLFRAMASHQKLS